MHKKRDETLKVHYYSKHLQKKLDLLDVSQAAVIEAPSGYGKTTAIRDYLEGAADRGGDVHWFTAADEAPQSLYRRLCREIEKIDERTGERLRQIDFPNAFTIGDACDTIRSVECHRKTWLVIDDFQFFRAALPLPFSTALLNHNSDKLCVVIITQTLGQDFFSAVAGRGILHITTYDLQLETEDIRSYYALTGADITGEAALKVKKYTDGWIIAVYLQLCAFRETGKFSDEAVLRLMEHLVWNKMRDEQQVFFMQISMFNACTVRDMCGMLSCTALPDYAVKSLSVPFIRYIADRQCYEFHSILFELVRIKRGERGEAFEKECLIKAGDLCRREGRTAEALDFYVQLKDYERILSLDLSQIVNAGIGDGSSAFFKIAPEIAKNCPAEIKREYPLSMLCVAWALRLLENSSEFDKLMNELGSFLSEYGLLRAEWLLLSAYQHFSRLDNMLIAVRSADALFQGNRSRVILPEAPWAFYEYVQLVIFHINVGEADREADALEEFIALYSKITGGHGSGADVLFRAELAYLRCETIDAEIYAYKAIFIAESKRQKIIQIGAARLLGEIALLKADADDWKCAVGALEKAAAGPSQNTPMFRTLLDVVRGILLTGLKDYENVADWLKTADFTSRGLPASVKRNALATHLFYLLGRGEFARFIGLGQAHWLDSYTVFSKHLHFFLMAIGYISLGDRVQASESLERIAESSMSDGWIHYFVAFSWMLKGLSDELIENKYPHILPMFIKYKEKYATGWIALRNSIIADELPCNLTEREREVALLVAEGLRNNEIAKILFVSENTVRAHLRAIFQKLDIDRRAKLFQKLK
ncbi:MAG: LuxR C-terminal-related transcriptional regulator [Oscillospiraceae bacterium]|jgi:LuxR family maltose regulon positive regulatory protein|nr:LuxR C-terminal-related transcriptional regulator [Oscillospiraceae bacterium]